MFLSRRYCMIFLPFTSLEKRELVSFLMPRKAWWLSKVPTDGDWIDWETGSIDSKFSIDQRHLQEHSQAWENHIITYCLNFVVVGSYSIIV